MAMFKWAGTARSQNGDSLSGWQIECVDFSDNETVIPIYSDENQTPISVVSGIENRALTDAIGNYSFFVASGTYNLKFYDEKGTFRRTDRFFSMYGADQVTDELVNAPTVQTLLGSDLIPIVRNGEVDIISADDFANFFNLNPPIFTTSPTISENPFIGDVVTSDDGVVNTGAIVGRNWLRDGLEIAGQTQSTYTLQNADEGALISLSVTASSPGGVTVATSNVIGPIEATLTPSASWNGTAGSGFTSTPSDPARVTAKPAARLIVPENQRFTDTLVIGVSAYAINGRSLIGGINKVTFYCEGNTLDVTEPSLREFTRVDGSTYQCLGYWVAIKKPIGTSGAANIYAEAVPSDATMQNRVIGPFAFYPQDTLYDQDVTVGAAGDYADIGAAITALKGLAPDNARIQLIDNGDYPIGGGGATYFGNSYLVIEPAEGVSARITDPTGPNPGGQGWRPKYDRMWLRDVTIDMNTIEQIYDEGPSDGGTENHVLERCKFEATRELWFGGVRGVSYMVRGMPEFLECDFTGCYEVGNNAKTMRGNTGQGNWGDFTSQCPTVLYNDLDDQEFESFAGTIDVVTVNYTGGGSATLSKTGNNAGPAVNRTEDFVMKVDGVQVGTTLQMWQSAANYDLNDGRYWNEDFVTWVNGLPDFTATSLIPNLTRQGRPINQPGSTSNSDFADLPIGASITLVSDFDFHTDGIVSGGFENGIHFNNQLTRFDGQGYFLAAAADYLDIICANNIFEGLGTLVPFSQVENGDFEHMVIAHNTWSTQILNFGQGGATYDAYCELSNNVAWNIIGDATGVSSDNNHLASDGPQTTASGLTNTVVAGTAATMFVDAAGRDFTPANELLTSLAPPVIERDLQNAIRTDPGAKGAIKLP